MRRTRPSLVLNGLACLRVLVGVDPRLADGARATGRARARPSGHPAETTSFGRQRP